MGAEIKERNVRLNKSGWIRIKAEPVRCQLFILRFKGFYEIPRHHPREIINILWYLLKTGVDSFLSFPIGYVLCTAALLERLII